MPKQTQHSVGGGGGGGRGREKEREWFEYIV